MNRPKYYFSMWLKVTTKLYFQRNYNIRNIYKGFNPNRKGPFFLIGNHVVLLDPFFANYAIKGYAIPVANAFVYTNAKQRIGLTYGIDSIVKRKGQSDIGTIRSIKKHIKNEKSIQLYPEGNTSYYGNNTESMYSTAKLFKSQKIDVIVIKTKGGYFSKPRWRETRADKPYIELEFSTLFTGKDLSELSVDEIFEKMTVSYNQNDYEWNRVEKHIYKGKNRLLGSHRVIYACPQCNSINHISSEGDSIICDQCGTKGTINDYGFIENTIYDNFVDWGRFQEQNLRKHLDKAYVFNVKYYKVNWKRYKRQFIANVEMVYSQNNFTITINDCVEKIVIKEITGEAYSRSNQLSFDYNNETYFFITEKPKLLLDLIRFNKEE